MRIVHQALFGVALTLFTNKADEPSYGAGAGRKHFRSLGTLSIVVLVMAVVAGMAQADVIVLQAEDWMAGGNGVGYQDDDTINGWSNYRPSDTADVESSGDVGGWSVGWTNAGEWLILTTNPLVWNQAPTFAGGDYTLYYRVAAGGEGGTFHVEVDGTTVDTSSVGGTGGWLNWTTVASAAPVAIGAGTHEIKFACDTAGFNINWIALSNEGEPAAPVENTPVVLAPNGSGGFNAYQVVNTALPLSDAKAAAEAMSFPGLPGVTASTLMGHLATFSSEGEFMGMNGVIRQNESDPWIGMTDDETILPGAVEFGNTSGYPVPQNGSLPSEVDPVELGAGMRMVDGTPFTFHRRSGWTEGDFRSVWNGGEPNDSGNNEDGIQLTSSGGLNDNNVASSFRYVVEWDVNLADMPRIGPAGGLGYFGVRELAKLPNQPDTTYEAVAALYNDDQNNNGNPLYRRAVRVEGTMPVVNCVDPESSGGGGSFGDDIPFLSNTSDTDDNFVMRANGTIRIPEDGEWTFYGRGDDGLMIRIPGQTWNAVLASENNTGFVEGDSLVFNNPTGNSNLFGTINLAAGNYPIEITWFELGGGANVEVAAAKGSTTDLSRFRIIGSGVAGAPAVPAHDSIVPALNGLVTIEQSQPGQYVNPDDAADVTIDNLAEAEYDLANTPMLSTIQAPYVNHGDPDAGGPGRFGPDDDNPYDQNVGAGTDDNDFGMRATGQISITDDGTYYFGFNSDDGAKLQLVGQTWLGAWDNCTEGDVVIDGDTLITDVPTGWSDTWGEVFLTAGTYDFTLTMFERASGSYFELFGGTYADGMGILMQDAYTIHVDEVAAVADALELVPEPATISLVVLALGGLGLLIRRKR